MCSTQTIEACPAEYTFLLCEYCFDVILEEDADLHQSLAYCQHCIGEVRS